jgi:ribosome biogenesis GTPase A
MSYFLPLSIGFLELLMLLLMELLQLTNTLILWLKIGVVLKVVGFVNLRKNSLLKNLKRTKMANVGVNPSVTKAMQEIHLDMHVKLLDYFGIIFV